MFSTWWTTGFFTRLFYFSSFWWWREFSIRIYYTQRDNMLYRLAGYLKNILLVLIFYHAWLWVRTAPGHILNPSKHAWIFSYFAQSQYILVLAALTRALGWKSMTKWEKTKVSIWFLNGLGCAQWLSEPTNMSVKKSEHTAIS